MQKSTLSTISGFVLDMVFPRSCLVCRNLLLTDIQDTYLCATCRGMIPLFTVSRCAFCRKATTLWATCDTCKPNHALKSLLVAADYGDLAVKRMVKALKYRFVTVVAHDIGEIMARYLKDRLGLMGLESSKLIITSIPLHSQRLRWRGFNQADLIARDIAQQLSLSYLPDVLVRTKATSPQADIKNRDERIKNAKDIFAVGPLAAVRPLAGKTILLVDDVATTGATLDDAARVLKAVGAKHVIGFVFARG